MPDFRGFTLIELIVTVTLTAIVAAFALPSMARLLRGNEAVTLINRFNVALHYTRSEAVRRSQPVVLCKAPDGAPPCVTVGGWHQGWLIFVDRNGDRLCEDADGNNRCDLDGGPVLRRMAGFADNGFRLDGGSGNTGDRVVYAATGFNDGYFGTFTLCDTTGDAAPRGLTLSRSGRVRRRGEGLDCGGS